MLIYTITFLLIIVFIFISGYKKSIICKIISILTVATTSSLLVGLRPTNAGYDTHIYIDYFESLQGTNLVSFWKEFSYNFSSDYLFRLWTYFLSILDLNSSTYIFINAFIAILMFLFVLSKLFPSRYLHVFLFFFVMPGFITLFGNGIRQGLALPLFLFSIYFFLCKNKKACVLFLLCTLLFHTFTGVCLFLTYVLYFFVQKLSHLVLFLILLFIQPFIFLVQNVLYKIYPIQYLSFISTEYLFHYSVILVLCICFVFFFIKKDFYSMKIFHLLASIMLIIASCWFNPTAFGRLVYLSYPLIAYLVFKVFDIVPMTLFKPLLFASLYLIGFYFLNSESAITTLN